MYMYMYTLIDVSIYSRVKPMYIVNQHDDKILVFVPLIILVTTHYEFMHNYITQHCQSIYFAKTIAIRYIELLL